MLVATFLINLDTTIVNVALPALGRQLRASTSDLQWVVDAYNLAFAGLVLTGGTIGDRFGRRGTLAVSLLAFGVSSGLAATATSTGPLIAWRVVMGVAAAFVFPTTLSLISQSYPERAARAKAIGAWGAATGAAVAFGPVVGGALLEHYSWSSVFAVMVPLGLGTALAAVLVVPHDTGTRGVPLDLRGMVLSAAALTALVYTVIEAPGWGWASGRTLDGLVLSLLLLVALIAVERQQVHPMLDVRLFANLRFTAASGAVTLAFFALSGFIFLIIQYFQITQGYSALEAGVRTLPVAICIGVSSGIGTVLSVRLGNKVVVTAGLLLVGSGYTWIALAQTTSTPYGQIVAQMVLLGTGMGLSTAPATEAILGVVRPEQAGIGSAVNDATRLVGGALGVAVVGSVSSSLYRHGIDRSILPAALRGLARDSYGTGHALASSTSSASRSAIIRVVDGAFLDGLHAGCGVAAAACFLGAAVVAVLLPAHPAADSAAVEVSDRPTQAPAVATA